MLTVFNLEDHLEDDEEELLEALGDVLISEGIGFGSEDPDRRRRFAARWLADRQQDLKEHVCPHQMTQTLLADRPGALLMEVATVADVLAAAYGRPTASVVALILVRRGLATFCDGYM
ncbi:hypothetical protein GKC29_25315 [Micromonospora sp. WMMC415]|uniref:hypothetical protein n=1 Tax=Micromonospora sp. WMMC415 TaxID=2675222 RepID=UPI0012B50276|nr:hypothetical protein [Micromonospora sp. WMMC415]QGN49816.1 hypothetical protein GKC29_25315 [Micromonospora sp. WMMC415]